MRTGELGGEPGNSLICGGGRRHGGRLLNVGQPRPTCPRNSLSRPRNSDLRVRYPTIRHTGGIVAEARGRSPRAHSNAAEIHAKGL